MKRNSVIIFCRISTAKQMQGNSVADQIEQGKEFAKKNNMEVVDVVKVQASGKKQLLNIGELAATLDKAKKMKADLVCSKIDRLSRDQISLLALKRASEENGIEIHVASMGRKISDISDLEFSMIAVLAESERKQIVERTKRASIGKVGTMGLSLDPSKMGRRSAEARARTTANWAETIKLKQRLVQAIKELRKPTLARVCRTLNGDGIPTITGKKWNHVTLIQQIQRLNWSWKEIKNSAC